MTERKERIEKSFNKAVEQNGEALERLANVPEGLQPKRGLTTNSASLFIMMTDRLAILSDRLEVLGQDGKWNSDEYMCGIYNGLEYSVAVMENREPKFRTVLHDDDNNVPIRFLKHKDEQ